MEKYPDPNIEESSLIENEQDDAPSNMLESYNVIANEKQDLNENLRHRDWKVQNFDTEDNLVSVMDISKETKISAQEPERTSSLLKGIYNIINTTIGAGILALPFQMKSVGLIVCIVLLLIIGVLSTFTLHLLNEIGRKTKIDSYMGVADAAYGKPGQFIVALSIWLLLIAALSGYDVIIGTYLVSAVKFLRGVPQDGDLKAWYFTSEFLSACVAVVVAFPLSLLPKFSKLAYASLACLVAIAYLNIVIIYQFIHDATRSNWKWPPLTMAAFDISTFLPALATIGMAYINQVSIYNVTAELKNPTPKRKLILIILSNSVVVFVYITFALFGYLNYGDLVTDNVLRNEPLDTQWTIARIAVAFVMALTIPLLTFPTRQCFDWMIHECYMLIQKVRHIPVEKATASWDRTAKFRYVAESILIILISYAIAIAFGALGKILEFFGSITGASILYIFPCLFYMRIMRGGVLNSLRSRNIIDWVCNFTLVFGLIIFFVGTILSIMNFTKK